MTQPLRPSSLHIRDQEDGEAIAQRYRETYPGQDFFVGYAPPPSCIAPSFEDPARTQREIRRRSREGY